MYWKADEELCILFFHHFHLNQMAEIHSRGGRIIWSACLSGDSTTSQPLWTKAALVRGVHSCSMLAILSQTNKWCRLTLWWRTLNWSFFHSNNYVIVPGGTIFEGSVTKGLNSPFHCLDNSVLPETKTLVFPIFSLVKRWTSDGPNVLNVRVCPKKVSLRFCCHLFLQNLCFHFSLPQFVKRTLHVGLKISILFFVLKTTHYLLAVLTREILFSPQWNKNSYLHTTV